jgi:predicted amidophosphoribosyltransferase
LCKSCKKKLKPHPEICPLCHRYSQYGQVCLQCQLKYKPPIQGIAILFSYNQVVKKLILSLKYFHIADIAKFLAYRMYNYILTVPELNNKEIIVTNVPAHRFRKYFIKGYNQSEILAKNLAKIA